MGSITIGNDARPRHLFPVPVIPLKIYCYVVLSLGHMWFGVDCAMEKGVGGSAVVTAVLTRGRHLPPCARGPVPPPAHASPTLRQALGLPLPQVDARVKGMRWTAAAVGISFFNMLFLLISLVREKLREPPFPKIAPRDCRRPISGPGA